MLEGFVDDFPQAHVIDFAAGNRPAALAVVCWSTYAGSGFNSWEGQPRQHPWDLTPTSLRLGVSLMEIGMLNPFCRLGSSTGRLLESWKRSRRSVSSHPATNSQGTQRLSTRLFEDGQFYASAEEVSEVVNQPLHAQAAHLNQGTNGLALFSRQEELLRTCCKMRAPDTHGILA